MSYADIINKFEEVVSYQNSKKEDLLNLSSFFISYKKIIETFANKLVNLSKEKIDLENTSLNKAFSSIYDHIIKTSESFQRLADSLQIDIIEPLDLFQENYYNMLNDIQNQGLDISKNFRSAQNRTLRLRSEYYQSAGEAEKAARIAIIEDSTEKREFANKMEQKYSLKTEEDLNDYLDSVLVANEKKEVYLKTVLPLMTCLQQNEESRIHFVKNTLEKYLRYFGKLGKNLSISIEKLTLACAEINPSNDLKFFVSLHNKEKENPEDFVTYQEWKKSLNENEYEIVEQEIDILSSLQSFLTNPVLKLNPKVLNDLDDLAYRSEGRKSFIESLLKTELSYINKENLILLSKYIRGLLDQLHKNNEYDAYLFCKLVEISTKFFTNDPTKKSLSSYLSSHEFWKDTKRWVQGINYAVNTQTILTKSKNFKDEITDCEEIGKIEKISAYVIIGQFNYQLTKLEVPIDISVLVIKSACSEYQIEPDRVSLILVELHSKSKTVLKHANLAKTSNFNEFILLKVCKFMSSIDLLRIAKLNKKLQEHVKRLKNKRDFRMKKLLIQSNRQVRRKLWLDVLETTHLEVDYETLLLSINEKDENFSAVNRIIEMDVLRSYQKSPEVNQSTLKNILKAFAVSNPEIGYCQGMNYLAGTLLYVIQDESLAFKALTHLISNYKMSSLLTNNLKKLKKLVFVFDKLISIHLPALHETFKDTWVLAEQFSTGWFIAIFGGVFIAKLEILLQIWDVFLVEGWKGMFKICIYILSQLESQLIDKSFEEILYILNNVSSSGIFTAQFFSDAVRLKIRNRSISELKKIYKSIF